MAHTTLLTKTARVACSMLAVFALASLSTASVSAQSTDEMTTLHPGAPLEDAKGTDKGKGKPPTVPSTGPGTVAILAVAAGAGYLTMRRLRA